MDLKPGARCAWPANAILGEGPLWSARDNAVYWVDIKGQVLHRLSLADESRKSWAMPERICWVIERRDHAGFVAGFKSGFAFLTLDPVSITPIGNPDGAHPGNRLNDAKADAQGCICAGSMDDDEIAASGSLFRLAKDRTWQTVDTGYRIANGPAFNADGSRMYHTDSALQRIYAFDVKEGVLSNKRVFLQFKDADGYPDGMTVDAQDHLWVAHWGGSRVSRFHPDASLDRAIALPASQVTSCVFAGNKLDRMFVTTAAIGLSEARRAAEPLAGGLFEVDPGCSGLPPGCFHG
ncbi:MAG TPA: SMP-30/gluconolactonase/LRE family protein [Burkholderiales bacterium]|nr:SMP-30/gluconolactonase/LRE family protein [Burkholderiales bacterium]